MTDNDKGGGDTSYAAAWKAAGLDRLLATRVPDDAWTVKHAVDLPRRDKLFVRLDASHQGVGAGVGRARSVRGEYPVPPGRYRLAFRLSTLKDAPASA